MRTYKGLTKLSRDRKDQWIIIYKTKSVVDIKLDLAPLIRGGSWTLQSNTHCKSVLSASLRRRMLKGLTPLNACDTTILVSSCILIKKTWIFLLYKDGFNFRGEQTLGRHLYTGHAEKVQQEYNQHCGSEA